MIWNGMLERLGCLSLVTPIVFQETISQVVYHAHTCDLQGIPRPRTLFTRVLRALGVSKHLSDGTSLKKRIAIEPQIKKILKK